MLNNIKVLDFSRYIAGPYCGSLLSAVGAEVVRVEKPEGGEDRFVGPVAPGLSALFLKTGCGKKSMTLNFRHPDSKKILSRLISKADVIIANMTNRMLLNNGLDYESIKSINSRAILVTQTCFGHKGQWANLGGFDGIGQAMSGAAYLSGDNEGARRTAAPYVDYATAALGAFGVLSALINRQSTNVGDHVQVSLLGSSFGVFAGPLIEQAVLGLNRQPTGNRGQTAAPVDIIKTENGSFIIQVVGNGLFTRLLDALGISTETGGDKFQSD